MQDDVQRQHGTPCHQYTNLPPSLAIMRMQHRHRANRVSIVGCEAVGIGSRFTMSQATRNQAPEFPAFLESFLREANECEDCWLVVGDEVFFPLSESEQNTRGLNLAKATVMDIQDAKDRGMTDEECEQLDEDEWYGGVMLALEVEVPAGAEGVEVKPRTGGEEGKTLTVKVQGRNCWGPLEGTKKGVHAGTVGYSVLEDDVYDLKLSRSPRFMDLWEHHQRLDVSEGVRWSDGAAPPALLTQLRESIDAYASSIPVDIHPGTHGVVRDIVHPSLYPFIRGVSPGDADLQQGLDAKEDMWGRAYEDSVYQWLPSEFAVDTDGACSIDSYINNLPRTEANEALYCHLATLFEAFLPMLEEVLQYGRSVQFMQGEMPFDDSTPKAPEKPAMPPVRGSTLQVVSKIAEYTLEPGQTFEGVWHVEGLPQENIAATALCILDRSEQLEGGTLLFKRAFLEEEAQHIFYNVPQCRHSMVEDIVSGGLLPLGCLPTDVPGRMIAFPNSHVHKVSKLLNAGSETARRRIVVFFVVNPERRIVSTRDVPPQQETMSLEDALEHRLTLMKERKYHKQDWNIREIELCEH